MSDIPLMSTRWPHFFQHGKKKEKKKKQSFTARASVAQLHNSIKSLFTRPTEEGSKIFIWLQLAVVDLRRYLIFTYAP